MNFNNFDEGIEYILNRFQKEELETFSECSRSEIHFSLSIWIKNEFIYNEDCNLPELIINREKQTNPLYKKEIFPTPHHHEELSHIVIEELINKLKLNGI